MGFIDVENITKDYGDNRGIFDVNFSIKKGESFGFIGINGAGKTTTIRHLMGFLKAKSGKVEIDGLDAWKDSAEIKKRVGYIPGEIAFPNAATGTIFLKQQAELLDLKDMTYANYLIEKLQLDPSATLKRMSKGMKQKTAIVAALMANPDILIFDEPTTGLDPLMRIEFIDIIEEQRKQGKTIFMSSNMFDEVESLCDRVASIKDGRVVDIETLDKIKHKGKKTYQLEFNDAHNYQRFLEEDFQFSATKNKKNQVIFTIEDKAINKLFASLKEYNVKSITEIEHTLEEYFHAIYEREENKK